MVRVRKADHSPMEMSGKMPEKKGTSIDSHALFVLPQHAQTNIPKTTIDPMKTVLDNATRNNLHHYPENLISRFYSVLAEDISRRSSHEGVKRKSQDA